MGIKYSGLISIRTREGKQCESGNFLAFILSHGAFLGIKIYLYIEVFANINLWEWTLLRLKTLNETRALWIFHSQICIWFPSPHSTTGNSFLVCLQWQLWRWNSLHNLSEFLKMKYKWAHQVRATAFLCYILRCFNTNRFSLRMFLVETIFLPNHFPLKTTKQKLADNLASFMQKHF